MHRGEGVKEEIGGNYSYHPEEAGPEENKETSNTLWVCSMVLQWSCACLVVAQNCYLWAC